MKYKLLKSLYYENNKKYEEEYERRINSPAAIRLNFNVKDNNNNSDGGNPAFILTTPYICNLISQIYRMNLKIEELQNNLPGRAILMYKEDCLVEEILITNDMEGVRSTRKEISEVILDIEKNNRSTKRLNCIIKKYMLMFSEEISEKITKPQDIRKLYDELVLEDIPDEERPDGKLFRKCSVSVMSPTQKEKHVGVVSEQKIIILLESALDIMYDEKIEPLIRIGIFHYMFGYIHPFYDGNGRTARFISSLSIGENLNQLIAYRLSYSIKNRKNDYDKAFDICNDKKNKGDLTHFVEMFLEMILNSEKHIIESLNECEKILLYYGKKIDYLDETSADILFILIQNSLFEEDEGIDRKSLAKYSEKSYSTVTKVIGDLIKVGFPIQEEKKSKLFVYNIDLDKLEDFLENQYNH